MFFKHLGSHIHTHTYEHLYINFSSTGLKTWYFFLIIVGFFVLFCFSGLQIILKHYTWITFPPEVWTKIIGACLKTYLSLHWSKSVKGFMYFILYFLHFQVLHILALLILEIYLESNGQKSPLKLWEGVGRSSKEIHEEAERRDHTLCPMAFEHVAYEYLFLLWIRCWLYQRPRP